MNRDVLGSAKPGLHLINIARGGLLDQEALLEALDNGQIGLASLDVAEP
ncbi:D-3-phosphoglycerate dehydrogenase [Pseudomonas sp. 24 E 1]|nr:D-3-phosphoglycerate dehydrogenase [Pseudomonas sp. 58 R 12]CRM50066.1 D-3-phosphoglycerate dehydrogenase [Pseudomonas sp. 24 E 1]CRM65664.1 D-3-phosphoglycerate dehydrogenase [Pseudomonas sp. 24 R 17]